MRRPGDCREKRRRGTAGKAGLKPRPYINKSAKGGGWAPRLHEHGGQNSNLTPNCADRGVLHCVLTVPNAGELQFWFGSQ